MPSSEQNQLEIKDEVKDLPLKAKVGSLLFVSTKPITTESIADAAKASYEEVEQAIQELSEQFSDEENGFSLSQVAGAWQFRTSPNARITINGLIPPKARRLSRAAAETLAVIAYRQPVQKAEIEAIRGVDALPTIKTLVDARLIRIVGREQSPGQPALYGTTQQFLEKFGLGDLSELPTVRELEELEREPGESEQGEICS